MYITAMLAQRVKIYILSVVDYVTMVFITNSARMASAILCETVFLKIFSLY